MTDRSPSPRWAVSRPADVALAIVGLLSLGATAFGLWHIVVGGLVNGNPRAAGFGAGLALAAGIPLVIGWFVIRRRRAGR